MKKNKKLFLASIAAMGAVAIGTGAVSTFAWYQTAASGVSIDATGSYTLSSTVSEVTLADVTITFTISSGDTLQLSNVNGGNVEYGGIPNGAADPATEKQVHNWDGNNSSVKLIGQYTVSIATNSATPAQKEALKGLTYRFPVQTKSNAVILNAAAGTLTLSGDLSADQKTANLNAAKATAASPYIQVVFDASGEAGAPTLSNPYFAVRTNNAGGLEHVSKGTLGAIASPWAAGDYASGAAACHGDGDAKRVYKANAAMTSSDTVWTEGTTGKTWQTIDHLDDSIFVDAENVAKYTA